MRGLSTKHHKSISGNQLPMQRVKSAVLLIVSFAVHRFIRGPRKPHDYNVIIVSGFPNEASCIYWRQGIPSSSLSADSGSSLQPRCDAAASLRADIQIALHREFFCAVARLTGAWIDQRGDLNRRLKAGGSGHAKTIFASNS